MKMRRVMFSLMLAGAVISMAACGSDGTETAGSAAVEQQESQEQEKEQTAKEADADFQQVLVDDENVKVEITGVEHSGLWGYTWDLSIENKTEDTNLMVAMENVSVNGVMSDPLFATEVAAGKKANTSVSWSDEEFETNNIEEVTAVEFELHVYDYDDWMADAYVDEQMTVYPMGEDAAESVSRESSEEDMILFDNDQCSMVIKSVNPDGDWGYTLNVYMENKTDMNLMFSVNDASINDIMCDPFWATTIAAGKSGHSEIYWFSDTLEENGITDVTTIDLPITVYDEDDIMTDRIVDETFTIDPSQLATE